MSAQARPPTLSGRPLRRPPRLPGLRRVVRGTEEMLVVRDESGKPAAASGSTFVASRAIWSCGSGTAGCVQMQLPLVSRRPVLAARQPGNAPRVAASAGLEEAFAASLAIRQGRGSPRRRPALRCGRRRRRPAIHGSRAGVSLRFASLCALHRGHTREHADVIRGPGAPWFSPDARRWNR